MGVPAQLPSYTQNLDQEYLVKFWSNYCRLTTHFGEDLNRAIRLMLVICYSIEKEADSLSRLTFDQHENT